MNVKSYYMFNKKKFLLTLNLHGLKYDCYNIHKYFIKYTTLNLKYVGVSFYHLAFLVLEHRSPTENYCCSLQNTISS